jgi:hypothetical protein
MYLNSGDWIENLTALEYTDENWSIYQYDEAEFIAEESEEELPSSEQLFDEMLMEFKLMNRAILKHQPL